MEINDTLLSVENSINTVAKDISENGTDNLDHNIIKLIEDENSFKANLKVITTKDELLGSLLDMKV